MGRGHYRAPRDDPRRSGPPTARTRCGDAKASASTRPEAEFRRQGLRPPRASGAIARAADAPQALVHHLLSRQEGLYRAGSRSSSRVVSRRGLGHPRALPAPALRGRKAKAIDVRARVARSSSLSIASSRARAAFAIRAPDAQAGAPRSLISWPHEHPVFYSGAVALIGISPPRHRPRRRRSAPTSALSACAL